jgi:hypothetical protein
MTDQNDNTESRPLPQPVREHLGRELRAAYVTKQDMPAYLGDPALPLAFDEPLRRLDKKERTERRKRAHDQGVSAVGSALEQFLDPLESGLGNRTSKATDR